MNNTNKIKLIACDLDGTLLQNGAQACSPELFPLVEALSDQGILFMPASGRQYPNLQRLFAPVKDRLMYLCENGSLVIYEDRVLLKRQFEDGLALELCHAVLEHPDCEVLISGERVSYLIPKSAGFAAHMRDVVKNDIQIIDYPEQIVEPIIKVSYFTEPEYQARATEAFSAQFQGKCLIVTSGNKWVDFAPLGTSKGSAIAVVGERLNISPQEMAAFGDHENDRTMLEYVGHPYLMENAYHTMFDIPAKPCRRVEDSLREIYELSGDI